MHPFAVNRRHSLRQRENDNSNPVGRDERFGRDIQGIRPLLKRFEGRCEVFRSSDFEPDNFKSERAGRSLDLVHLEDRRGIIGVAHDRQPAKVGDNLAEEIETLATEIAGLARQACEIAARARQIRDQPAAERLNGHSEHNRDRRGCKLYRASGSS